MTPYDRIKKVFLDTNFYYHVEKAQIDLFIDVVQRIKNITPVMIELGVGDKPTYSQAFNAYFEGKCVNICTDIIEQKVINCRNIFPESICYHGYSGVPVHNCENKPDSSEKLVPLKLIDIVKENNIQYIDMLHFDVQGSEIYVLEEIEKENLQSKIGSMFISVHDTYDKCIEYIDKFGGFNYLFKHPTAGGYGDGLIAIERA
jgi:hypothetical protein